MMWEALCAAFEEAHADYYQVQTEGDQEEAGALAVFVPHRSFLNMTRKALKCPECDRRYLQPAITELTGITHGESFAIASDALVCPNCGFKTIPVEKMGEFALRISDAYREKYQLLTSSRIRDCRLDLGMSQQRFADYLGVGSSSVKRWELGQIQDKAMNNLMVLKTDLDAARENTVEVSTRLKQSVLGTGRTMALSGRALSGKDKYAVRRTK